MPNGTVIWFNTTKRFGFIEPDDGTKDVFVHVTAVQQAGMDILKQGQKLSYNLTTDERDKIHAVDLELLEDAPVSQDA